MDIGNLTESLYENFLNGIEFLDNMSLVNQYIGTDYKSYIRYPEFGEYIRTLVTINDRFDIYVITWGPHSKTPIHDHASKGCILKLLKGSLNETIYNIVDGSLELAKNKTIYENTTSFISNKIGYHDIENTSLDAAVSIHIYSPANYKPTIFNDIIQPNK